MNTIVLVTGGFDPIHSGHIAYFKSAKTLGDMLIVGLNSDEWLERKKGRAFIPLHERLCIINNLYMVDEVYTFDDTDGSACNFIKQVRAHYPDSKIIFANGGDRTKDNIPEMTVKDSNLEFLFGIGGTEKKNSSSKILEEWKYPKTIRPWGYYRVLYDIKGCKVKELVVNPGKSLSLQKHKHRSELWMVSENSAKVELDNSEISLDIHQQLIIPKNSWHRLYNPYDKECKLIEIQFGVECIEDDIERK